MGELASSSGDVAAWVGAIGTWVVGGWAAVIGIIQVYKARFLPKVAAYSDSMNKVAVRIVNNGSGTGLLVNVLLVSPDHIALPYYWLIADHLTPSSPLPIPLPGQSAAQLVLVSADGDFPPDMNVMLDFGRRRKIVKPSTLDAAIFGSTTIPGIQFAAGNGE